MKVFNGIMQGLEESIAHNEGKLNARAEKISTDAIPKATEKEYVNIRAVFRETDANGWIEIYDALDTLKWYSSEFHIEGNEELVKLLNGLNK